MHNVTAAIYLMYMYLGSIIGYRKTRRAANKTVAWELPSYNFLILFVKANGCVGTIPTCTYVDSQPTC